jgi:hypothetical protein
MAKGMSLLKAYTTEAIPANGGFIITSNFDSTSIYSIYEITAYGNVKDIFKSPDGLVFKTDGNRCHILVEPSTYAKKHTEPVYREEGKSIPYRFNDLHIITGHKQEKIMIAKEPVLLYSSFTILENSGDNYSFIFYPTEDVYTALRKFISDILYNDSNLTKLDAAEAAKIILTTIKKFTVWS